MSGISTHVLDVSTGQPAAGILVRLFRSGEEIGQGTTDQNGRIAKLLPSGVDQRAGRYRLLFEVENYLPQGFYPEVVITFSIRESTEHYHVPLLISAFGYTTYRGS